MILGRFGVKLSGHSSVDSPKISPFARNPEIGEQVTAILNEHSPKTIVMTDSLLGCPHEEGIDYPIGKSGPNCPYWAGRDRFTGDRIH